MYIYRYCDLKFPLLCHDLWSWQGTKAFKHNHPHPTSDTLHLLSTSFPCQTWEIVLTRKIKRCLLNISQLQLQRRNLLQKQSVLVETHIKGRDKHITWWEWIQYPGLTLKQILNHIIQSWRCFNFNSRGQLPIWITPKASDGLLLNHLLWTCLIHHQTEKEEKMAQEITYPYTNYIKTVIQSNLSLLQWYDDGTHSTGLYIHCV